MQKSKEAALKALEIDNTLAEAHASLAFVKLYNELDYAGADAEFNRAIELKPNYATAHHWRALNLSAMGQHDQAIAEIKRALELDPGSLIIGTAAGNIYYYAGLYDQAIEQCRKTIEMNQTFAPAHTILRLAYEKKVMVDEAFAEFQKERALTGESVNTSVITGRLDALSGQHAAALKVIERLKAQRPRQYVSACEIARLYALLGQQEQALDWLKKAEAERSISFAFVKVDPDFDNLRAHPQFIELLQRNHLAS